MFNIFLAVFLSTLGFAFVEPFFFIGYLVSIALFGLFQAIFMANAGAAWDNAKKIVETKLKLKGTALHAASVVGDTVGDPFKDTSSVAMNPVIKFTTLFGLLAVELGVYLADQQSAALRTSPPLFGGRVRLALVLRHVDIGRGRVTGGGKKERMGGWGESARHPSFLSASRPSEPAKAAYLPRTDGRCRSSTGRDHP
jgi:hypothetical protein